MGVKISLDLALYRNTGTFLAPVWNIVDNVKDVALNRTMGEGDASSRLNDVKMSEPVLQDASFEFAMVDDDTDTDLIAFRAAFDNRTIVEFASVYRATGAGFRYECKIFGLSEPQPLENVNVINVSAKPCYTTNPQGTAVVIP